MPFEKYILQPRYDPKIIGHILKISKRANVSVFMKLKMKIKIKNRSRLDTDTFMVNIKSVSVW